MIEQGVQVYALPFKAVRMSFQQPLHQVTPISIAWKAGLPSKFFVTLIATASLQPFYAWQLCGGIIEKSCMSFKYIGLVF
jgi:hypothetical protein